MCENVFVDRQRGFNYRQCKNMVSFGVHVNESYTLFINMLKPKLLFIHNNKEVLVPLPHPPYSSHTTKTTGNKEGNSVTQMGQAYNVHCDVLDAEILPFTQCSALYLV